MFFSCRRRAARTYASRLMCMLDACDTIHTCCFGCGCCRCCRWMAAGSMTDDRIISYAVIAGAVVGATTTASMATVKKVSWKKPEWQAASRRQRRLISLWSRTSPPYLTPSNMFVKVSLLVNSLLIRTCCKINRLILNKICRELVLQ